MKAPLFVLVATVSLMSLTQAEEHLPPDVQRLVDQRISAVEKIDKAFVLELDKLKTKYMRLGNLGAANTINELRKKHGSDQSDDLQDSGVSPFVGQWLSRGDNSIKRAKDTITETHFIDESGTRHPYIIEGNSIRVRWNGNEKTWLLITRQPGNDKTMKSINHLGSRTELQRVSGP